MAPGGKEMLELLSYSMRRETARVDWCEQNYAVLEYVAEFWNTMSSMVIAIIPVLSVLFSKEYFRRVNNTGGLFINFLFFIVGVTSVMYHSTLSLAGQLLDQISILWVLLGAFYVFFPPKYFRIVFPNRALFQGCMLILTIVLTAVCINTPQFTAFWLLGLMVPYAAWMYIDMKKCDSWPAKRLYSNSMKLLLVALGCWLLDKFMCAMLLKIGFPYMHSVWHVLSAVACHSAVVFIMFIHTVNNRKHHPRLAYWPSDTFKAIAYIKLNSLSRRKIR